MISEAVNPIQIASDSQIDKKVLAIIDKLQIFSFLGQITLADRSIFIIPGVSHQHPISTLIQQVIEKTGIESTFYTINLSKSRFVPFHDLYDFDDQKWKITKL